LEGYSAGFDALFSMRNRRHTFRRYLEGLLLPAERNKTLTALANTEPVVGAQRPRAQGLQWFLSESTWAPDAVNARRLGLLRSDRSTAPTVEGVLVIDEHGDRKWGDKTAHVGRQYLANIGKIDSGVVSVTSLWADERVYWPVDFEPYTPAHHFERGKQDPGFRTKLGIAGELVGEAVEAGAPFRAVGADSFYGEDRGFKRELERRGVGYVLALKPSHAWWHPETEGGSLEEAAAAGGWTGPESCGAWVRVVRAFRDGPEEVWWALEVELGPYGPARPGRAVVATTDPATLPQKRTWYLETNLPAPASERAREGGGLHAADLAEVVRLYGLRMWVEQSYKQVKHSLGWSQYQVRSDRAIRRHWELVCCAFSFCWHNQGHPPGAETPPPDGGQPAAPTTAAPATDEVAGRGGNTHRDRAPGTTGELADGAAGGQGVVGAVGHAAAILDSLVGQAPAAPTARAA
jgi:SRSO17 transposase